MKAVVAAFNQEKALVGAFSVITNLWMELFEALLVTQYFIMVVISGLVSGHADTLLMATAFRRFSMNLTLLLSIAANSFCIGSGAAIVMLGYHRAFLQSNKQKNIKIFVRFSG